MSDEYNGWSNYGPMTNYETEATRRWLADATQFYRDMATTFLRTETDRPAAVAKLAQWCEDAVRDTAADETGDNSLFADLLDRAFARVNWTEIAEHYFPEK